MNYTCENATKESLLKEILVPIDPRLWTMQKTGKFMVASTGNANPDFPPRPGVYAPSISLYREIFAKGVL